MLNAIFIDFLQFSAGFIELIFGICQLFLEIRDLAFEIAVMFKQFVLAITAGGVVDGLVVAISHD